ncbi:MAG: YihY family inner membrane protein [Phycisphaeraceae bacterium]|nr:YihY family inner membrane protein [Phycisphaeraceae bacterium]
MKFYAWLKPSIDADRPGIWRQLVHVAHLCAIGVRDSQLARMAAALSYRTIFGLIPVIVIGLVVMASFAQREQVSKAVFSLLEFIGLDRITLSAEAMQGVGDGFMGPPAPGQVEQGLSLNKWIGELVDRIRGLPLNAIGFAGVLTLIYAAISMLVEIEKAFNQIYHAPTGRAWARRVTQYWSLLTLGTFFLVASFAITEQAKQFVRNIEQQGWAAIHWPNGEETAYGAVEGLEGVPGAEAKPAIVPAPAEPVEQAQRPGVAGGLVLIASRAISLALSITIFVIIYATVPNTRVHVVPALVGACIAATLWELGKWGFTEYVSYSATYSRLYGVIALLPLFLLWVYLTWMIVLFGLHVAYAMQAYRTAVRQGFSRSVLTTLGLVAEQVAMQSARLHDPASLVLVMSVVGERFSLGKYTDHEHVADRTGLDKPAVVQMLNRLCAAGFVHRVSVSEQEEAYTLSRPPDKVSLTEIFSLAQEPLDRVKSPAAQKLLESLAAARLKAVEGKTLTDAITA